ncbi:hypothetical protein A1O3_01309 [Capronia epimyces CBS 606.96]|uniref:C2H2-type domain-containing protein n=1 Tax=Capronia epimyces CBS 606.96 TaxID=1182542 RepID=W9YIN7_9EURO|nr:uncharacterized protein A1O3_01309 [Capronia epimyces CBS 606.96]EXJ92757.1 hypothetical protein A1O3_01309 [Capronia epimyces CBS 606.96]
MEEPFRKRPRLSIFADEQADTDLDADLGALRYRNDNLLKLRFESIFEKYSHDFTGVGDEIDLVGGEIVVNNGHLESMEDETDTGETHDEDEKGKSFLRAMTEAPDGGDPYSNQEADNVITSIEGIAENAALSDDESSDYEPSDDEPSAESSEEDLLPQAKSRTPYFTPPDSQNLSLKRAASQASSSRARSHAYESDNDSLFEVREQQRSNSPDSLFEVRASTEAYINAAHQPLDPAGLGDDVDEKTILQKYGPEIGQEVLEMLRKTRNMAVEAHVEPAWRLPADLVPAKPLVSTRSASGSKTPSKPLLLSPGRGDMASSKYRGSVWRATTRQITPRIRQESQQRHVRIREESEDPLQDGFSSDHLEQAEDETHLKTEEDEDTDVVVWKSNRRNGRGNDEQVVQMKRGICFYCSRQWKTRNSVFNHWSSLVHKAEETGIWPDDVHDMVYIRDYWLSAPNAARGPRLGVGNLKRLVELHEGAGQSFDEIAESGLMRSKKTASQLKEVYVKYRKPRREKRKRQAREWSESELRTLDQLCQNPKSEVSTFPRAFENCSVTDVVDKLAEIWLAEFCSSGGEIAKRSESVEDGGEAEAAGKTPVVLVSSKG